MSNLRVFRHEFKYYINYAEYHVLRSRLKHLLKFDKFADENGNYHIRSLYFDDVHNSALYEKQSGILSREKFRIRIYNISDDTIKLEKKSRIGQFINKTSATLSRCEYESIIAKRFDFLKTSNNKLLNEFYFHIKAKRLKPDVIVDYVREAYTLPIGNVRITFDKNLRTGLYSTDLFDGGIPTVDVLESPWLVLEIKYDNFLPDYLRNVLQISSSQRFAISKFVICKKFTKSNNWEDN